MKSLITTVLLYWLSYFAVQACTTLPPPPGDVCEVRTYDTTTDLDWTQPNFTYYKLTNGVNVQSSLTSPFHQPPGNIPNVFAFSAPIAKDYAFEDGWRYVMHNFGTPQQGISNPWFILYNKHSGLLRIFIAIDEVLDDKQHAQISISWWSDTKTAALEHYSGNEFCHVLENFVDGAGKEPNIFVNTVSPPFWLHADFTMHYDPCTCNYNSQLHFEAFLVEESNLAFTLDGELNQLDLQADNAGVVGSNNANSTLAKAQSAANGFVGGIKSIGSGVGTLNKIFTEAQPGKPATPATYDADGNVITLAKPAVQAIPSGSVNSFKDVVNLFLGGGNIISGAVKLFGLLIGSSSKPTPAPPPKPLKFKVDLEATGQISSTNSYIDLAFENPGADHEGFVEGFIPHYDNVMGLFNLIEANIKIEQSVVFYPDFSEGVDAWRLSMAEPIEYVLNPNADVNYYSSDLDANYIKAAFEFTAPNGKIFSSDFYDLNCFNSYKPYWDYISVVNENGEPITGVNPTYFFDLNVWATIRIKIMALFTTNDGIQIPYVNRFKPEITAYESVYFGPPESDSPGGSIFPNDVCLQTIAGYPRYPQKASPERVSEICNSTAYQQKSGQQLQGEDPDQAAFFSEGENSLLEQAPGRKLNYDEIVVFPNPTTTDGYFTLRYGLAEEGPITISIYDMRGKLITVALQAGHHYPGIYDIGVTLPDNVSPGTYFIVKETNEGISKGTLVIQ